MLASQKAGHLHQRKQVTGPIDINNVLVTRLPPDGMVEVPWTVDRNLPHTQARDLVSD